MEFNNYQQEAKKTIQENANTIVPFLGLIGEAGSVISELKKQLRDGNAYTNYKCNLNEELGDLLWYISTIATDNNLSLEEIAANNLAKIKDRYDLLPFSNFITNDAGFPDEEQFPREFTVKFEVIIENGIEKVRVVNCSTGAQIGNNLSDNSHIDDGYRFHDIFHYGFVAYLGWSPVIRKLMGIKRRSKVEIDEVEDGARAIIVEELISLFIYNNSIEYQYFKDCNRVDTEVLKMIQKLVNGIEVKNISQKQWEITIINTYKVFHELIKNNGGHVLVSIKNRVLTYLGKNLI